MPPSPVLPNFYVRFLKLCPAWLSGGLLVEFAYSNLRDATHRLSAMAIRSLGVTKRFFLEGPF